MSQAWFQHLLGREEVLFLVAQEGAEVVGFLIAQPQPAPPVYDPGGPTALIDDFWVDGLKRWVDVGAALLADARTRLRERGFAQVVVVSPDREQEKKDMLAAAGLSIASTWWTAGA